MSEQMNIGNATGLLTGGQNADAFLDQLQGNIRSAGSIFDICKRIVVAWPIEADDDALPAFGVQVLRQLPLPLHDNRQIIVVPVDKDEHVPGYTDRIRIWGTIGKSANLRDPFVDIVWPVVPIVGVGTATSAGTRKYRTEPTSATKAPFRMARVVMT